MASTVTLERIQILMYIRRKPDLTLDQFYEHWENVHGPTVISWAEKHGFERYQQVPPFLSISCHSEPDSTSLRYTCLVR
jgi:hypothetical protein